MSAFLPSFVVRHSFIKLIHYQPYDELRAINKYKNYEKMFLLEILKNLGINLSNTDNVPFEVFFSTNILILCTVSMFCVINIIIYLLVIKSIDTEYIQSKIINYSIVRKILNLYKKTSMTFIVIEFSFILYIHCFIIHSCYRIISAYYFT